MSKLIADDCRNLSVYDLKKWGCFDMDYHVGNIYWKRGYSDKESSIKYILDLSKNNVTLKYTVTDRFTDEKTEVDHKYPIVTTDCNYGNKRYWFICSVFNKGKYCGRRVAKLYLGGGSNYFACRHCYDLTYESRLRGWAYSFIDIDKAYEKVGRWYYRGKPTKSHIAYAKKQDSLNRDMLRMFGKFAKYDV